MKKIITFLIICFVAYLPVHATHIAGGELYYQYLGSSSSGLEKYKITMRLSRSCFSQGQTLLRENVRIGIYNADDLTFVETLTLTREDGSPTVIRNTRGAIPCLVGDPDACYQIGTFSRDISLPKKPAGYLLSWIRLTRTTLDNVIGSDLGATFTTLIPGSNQLPIGANSSPVFKIKDTTIVCNNSKFSIDFSAKDENNDSLSYKFSPAYGSAVGSANEPDPPPPPILSLPTLVYQAPYSGSAPLGPEAFIDSKTGIISGIAPISGLYVVCVTVEEWRNGVLINEHRKDFILTVNNCSFDAVKVNPVIAQCGGFDVFFQNQSTNSQINSYLWIFGDGQSSTKPSITHTYKDTGVYLARLFVSTRANCSDSGTIVVNVFPGFEADIQLSSVGQCIQHPFRFYDSSKVKFGKIIKWSWDFGEPGINTDTSSLQNPTYLYPTSGYKTVVFSILSDKGCTDNDTLQVVVLDKPTIKFPFKDTLICSIDTLQLKVIANGNFTWAPNYRISDTTVASPFVNPQITTQYKVLVNDNGCINTDSIRVRVLPFIKVDAGADTAICKTDSIILKPVSEALSYQWIASTGENVAPIKNPKVQPLTNTIYTVTANLGKCQDKDIVQVIVNPYPQVNAGVDTTICFGQSVKLQTTIIADSFFWRPEQYLTLPKTLSPISKPDSTITYVLEVRNTRGCLKHVKDSVRVTVVPKVVLNAGNDTSVVVKQPLNFSVITNTDTTKTSYLWSSTNSNLLYLDSPFSARPIGLYEDSGPDSIIYIVRATQQNGCFGEDRIRVLIYKSPPDILVPTAFTPENKDGLNDVLRPIPLGLKGLDFFNVYNRYGQLLYTTSQINKGWDGYFNGKLQPPGTYIFTVQATDYLGRKVFKKGTAVLIR